MARVSDEDWDKLQSFDTLRLIEAVDEVDAVRGMLADAGSLAESLLSHSQTA